jgi:PIN domain nuclease of toxin-antitoxin system
VPQPLLLDTHCWIWLQDGRTENFSPAARTAIRRAADDDDLLVSVISGWEIALLDSKKRISLSTDCEQWIREASGTPGLRIMPITMSIALRSNRLPGEFHGDQADRILVATAMMEGAQLLTKDRKILDYAGFKHVRVMSA